MLLESGCTTEGDQYSAVVIEQMRQQHATSHPGMECELDIFLMQRYIWSNADIGHEMDVRDLKFEDGAFDVAIDKGMSITYSVWCQLIENSLM